MTESSTSYLLDQLDEITLYCEICNKAVCIIMESRPTSIHKVCCVRHD